MLPHLHPVVRGPRQGPFPDSVLWPPPTAGTEPGSAFSVFLLSGAAMLPGLPGLDSASLTGTACPSDKCSWVLSRSDSTDMELR